MDTNQAMDKLDEVSETTSRMADRARAKFADASGRLMERSRAAATSTDAYVHEYAWSSIALAALLGVVVGILVRRS